MIVFDVFVPGIDDHVLALVANTLPHGDWYQIGLLHLGLSSLDLDNCDRCSVSWFRTVFNTVKKWFLTKRAALSREGQAQPEGM